MASTLRNRSTQTLSREARDAIKAVFGALSEWRDEVTAGTERYGETVLAKMAEAARALGWPNEIVDASHKQFVQASKAQTHLIEQMMDAWEKQLTDPSSEAFLSVLPGTSQNPAMELWWQTAQLWQQNWTRAISMLSTGSSRSH
jgi:hypothetical protein